MDFSHKAQSSKLKATSGFTLIEILVVMAVTGILSGIVILYGGTGKRITALMIETTKVAQVIERAKSRSALFDYDAEEKACGYGVRFDVIGKRYMLFKYLSGPSEDCEAIASVGEASYKELEVFPLPPGLVFEEDSSSIDDILFIPPDPMTLMFSRGVRVSGSHEVILGIEGETIERSVEVTSGGQISF